MANLDVSRSCKKSVEDWSISEKTRNGLKTEWNKEFKNQFYKLKKNKLSSITFLMVTNCIRIFSCSALAITNLKFVTIYQMYYILIISEK